MSHGLQTTSPRKDDDVLDISQSEAFQTMKYEFMIILRLFESISGSRFADERLLLYVKQLGISKCFCSSPVPMA